LGNAQALIATAHKIARVIFAMVKGKQPYQSLSDREYEERFREREVQVLKKRTHKLGLTLLDPAQSGVVS